MWLDSLPVYNIWAGQLGVRGDIRPTSPAHGELRCAVVVIFVLLFLVKMPFRSDKTTQIETGHHFLFISVFTEVGGGQDRSYLQCEQSNYCARLICTYCFLHFKCITPFRIESVNVSHSHLPSLPLKGQAGYTKWQQSWDYTVLPSERFFFFFF